VNVFLPGTIPKADVIFAFDLTGSMGGAIATAKSQALNIMSTLDTLIGDAQYGVVSFMDYPHYYSSYGYEGSYGSGPDYPYRLDQNITSDRNAVSNAIGALAIGNGDDGPEDYTRIMYESYADAEVGWRPGAKRILVLLGDSIPHDDNLNEAFAGGNLSTGGDPGRDEVMFTGDDLDLQIVLNGMALNNVVMLDVAYSGSYYLNYWQYWAGLTGGSAYLSESAGGIPTAIEALVESEAAHVEKLKLRTETGFEAWLTSVTPAEYTEIDIPPEGTARTFEINITVPLGTLSGTYKFHMIADADGATYGEQEVTIEVDAGPVDNEPPVITNVRHEPLYPMFLDEIFFYTNVTDNVAVAKVQLNYTLDGGTTWLLKDMALLEGDTYSTSLGPYNQFQIVGFYVIAYDTSGNMAWGSEIVPPLPEPPKVAPVVVADENPAPLPNGQDVWYDSTYTTTTVYVDLWYLGLYSPGLLYYFSYSIDGGLTWITGGLEQISEYIHKFDVPSLTNILFKIEASDGSSSKVYWIIVGPWKYPIYLYFSTDEKYYPVAGLDFDYEQTGDYDITNNKASYDTYFADYRPKDLDVDSVPDVPAYTYMKPKSLDDGCLVIEYWIYYAFNPYPIIDDVLRDDHEHDFESVYIWIDLATGNIKKMASNQHKWVNHYIFDVKNPLPRINLAVEEGGHGMAMLQDADKNGLPDLVFGHYRIAATSYGDIPFFFAGWQGERLNPDSFVARLYPWVTYDPRIPSSKLHLFDNSSILTAGLDWNVMIPQLSLDVSEIANDFQWITNMLGKSYLLKTDFSANLLLDSGMKLQFLVSAPLYRQEFREPAKMWNKVSWGWWTLKQIVKVAISFIVVPAVIKYFALATAAGLIVRGASFLLTNVALPILFDPVQGAVMDFEGNVLGYSNAANNLPGGTVVMTRNMTDNLYDLFVVFTNRSSEYVYEIRGIEPEDTYNFTVLRVDVDGNGIGFDATKIPIHAGETHRYIINWTFLENNESGVEVYVDQDGDEISERRFLSDAELTGEEFVQSTCTPMIESCDSTGNPEDTFQLNQAIYVEGSGYLPSTTYSIYLVNDTTWIEDMPIPQRVIETTATVSSDTSGNISATVLWNAPLKPGGYDIVVDANGDGYYNASIDALDESYIHVRSGVLVVPEYWLGTIFGLVGCFASLGVFKVAKRKRKLGD
jgi:hypothetical protein